MSPEHLKLPPVLQKVFWVQLILWFFSIFCIFEPLPTVTGWFWDPSFYTEDSYYKVQTFKSSHIYFYSSIDSNTQENTSKAAVFFVSETHLAVNSSKQTTVSLFSLIEFSVDSVQFNNNVNVAKFISYVNKFKWISMNIQNIH